MDLRTERKIKFWLTTISKVLVIAAILYKFIGNPFDKKDTNLTEKEIVPAANVKEKETVDSIPKKEPIDKQQKTSATLTQNKKTEDEKTMTTARAASPVYAKLHLVEDSFIWLKDDRKFVLKLANTTATLAENVTVSIVLIYEKEQQTILVKQKAFIDALGILNIDFTTSNLLHTSLPKTIILCINHESKDAKQKNWYKYLLENKVAGSGTIETSSIHYKTLSVSDGIYTNTPPNCIAQIKTTPNTTSAKNDNDIALDNIKSSTQLFIRGLNNKSQITIKNTTTAKLYTQLTSIGFNEYSYGFSNKIEVVSHTKNTAIVKFVLTEKGRTTYIQQQATYDAENSSKKASDFFKFLNRKGNGWEGKLVNQNGIWKFDIY